MSPHPRDSVSPNSVSLFHTHQCTMININKCLSTLPHESPFFTLAPPKKTLPAKKKIKRFKVEVAHKRNKHNGLKKIQQATTSRCYQANS